MRHAHSLRLHLLLLKLVVLEKLLKVLDLVVEVFFAACVLVATERRRVLQVDAAVLTIEVWHFY